MRWAGRTEKGMLGVIMHDHGTHKGLKVEQGMEHQRNEAETNLAWQEMRSNVKWVQILEASYSPN